MDGRRSLLVASCCLSLIAGCKTAGKKPPTAMPGMPPPMAADARESSSGGSGWFAHKDKKQLKPSTYVSIGLLKDQAAEDPDRGEGEREAYRYQARQSYQKAIDLDPKYLPSYVAMAKSQMASGNKDQSLAVFQKAIRVAPKDANLRYEMGTLLAQNKDWEGAIEALEQAVELEPENKQMHKVHGLTLARAGRYDDALAALSRCMPEPEARMNLARMMQHNQQSLAAEQQFKQAVEADPRLLKKVLHATEAPAQGVQQAGYREAVAPSPPVTTAARPIVPEAPALLPVITSGAIPPSSPARPVSPVQLGGS